MMAVLSPKRLVERLDRSCTAALTQTVAEASLERRVTELEAAVAAVTAGD